jgi:hypothetical protein
MSADNGASDLGDPAHRRDDPSAVGRALARLGVDPPEVFVAFHERYAGVLGGPTALELLDLCDGEPDYPYDPSYPSIVAATELVRDMYGLPHQYLVISTLVGDAVLVYDTTTDLVYNMDFEGGDEELRQGVLEPEYRSFQAMLDFFFRPARRGGAREPIRVQAPSTPLSAVDGSARRPPSTFAPSGAGGSPRTSSSRRTPTTVPRRGWSA